MSECFGSWYLLSNVRVQGLSSGIQKRQEEAEGKVLDHF
jgi:hypothetical protein